MFFPQHVLGCPYIDTFTIELHTVLFPITHIVKLFDYGYS